MTTMAWHSADCCSARAAYRITLPRTAAEQAGGELLLCGHHYRGAADALRRRRATVHGERNQLVDVNAAGSEWPA